MKELIDNIMIDVLENTYNDGCWWRITPKQVKKILEKHLSSTILTYEQGLERWRQLWYKEAWRDKKIIPVSEKKCPWCWVEWVGCICAILNPITSFTS